MEEGNSFIQGHHPARGKHQGARETISLLSSVVALTSSVIGASKRLDPIRWLVGAVIHEKQLSETRQRIRVDTRSWFRCRDCSPLACSSRGADVGDPRQDKLGFFWGIAAHSFSLVAVVADIYRCTSELVIIRGAYLRRRVIEE